MSEYDSYCEDCEKPLQGNEHMYCTDCKKKREYKLLHEDLIQMYPGVRFATIFDLNGKIMYSRHAQGVDNLLTPEESKRSIEKAVAMWKLRNKVASKIGKGKYVLAVYEKVKRITIPIDDNHLLYLTTDVNSDHDKIIDGTLKLIKKLMQADLLTVRPHLDDV